MFRTLKQYIFLIILLSISATSFGQHSIAREMNELVLTGIRNDFARPTIHARNLFHTSIAMYDIWAIYDDHADPYLMGNTVDGFISTLEDFTLPTDLGAARTEAIAYAVYRIMNHRYRFSPKWRLTRDALDEFMMDQGFDPIITSLNYLDGTPAHLGNYVAETIINYGFQDGSNEEGFYENEYYQASNTPLVMKFDGNPDISDPNRWQPLSVDVFIDQSGNEIPAGALDFLSPEWGNVHPFSLTEDDKTTYMRDGDDYQVYLDPGSPWLIDTMSGEMNTEAYQWGFSMVSRWSAHLSPTDEVMIDISPGALGNVDISSYPETFDEYKTFYDFDEGGDIGEGHDVNPVTGQPYPTNMVARGDYTRVLAEFWADGPDSETPPGHWFTLLNYVSDHPDFDRRYRADGYVLDSLEWDVKAYLIMGGAMHDCAIAAWGVKGWYDYLRPVSAIRYMCEKGQSSYPDSVNYHVAGIPLVEGFIELVVDMNDPLADDGENINKIKVKSWKGPDYINNPDTDEAGVDWILAEDWWPYQRPSFVTPPFAGYVSGHSTFSRAAAEVLTLITGDAFFPGGVGSFTATQNEFLVFEEGPSEDVVLQWATYRDASDQTSLSRIWGGIHPPIDDIPGRKMGDIIGKRAVVLAEEYFNYSVSTTTEPAPNLNLSIIENPINQGDKIRIASHEEMFVNEIQLINLQGQVIQVVPQKQSNTQFALSSLGLPSGLYVVNVVGRDWQSALKISVQ